MMQIKFNFNNFIFYDVCLPQRHTPSSLAAVIGLSINDVISLRSLRSLNCVRCVSCVGFRTVLQNRFRVRHYTINSNSLFRRTKPTTLENFYKIYKHHSSCAVRSSFYSERVVNIWNSLPVDTGFSSLARFIQRINSLEFSEFCCIGCYLSRHV